MKQLILFILLPVVLLAQNIEKLEPDLQAKLSVLNNNDKVLVWVFFKDKGTDLNKYTANPSAVVSEKSLKRRAKVLPQDKLIQFEDMPVNSGYIAQLEGKGFIIKQKSKWLNGVSGYVGKHDINNIASLSIVKSMDVVYKLKKDMPVKDEQGSLNKVNSPVQPEGTYDLNYGDSYGQNEQLNVPAVHNLGYTGAGVTIGMMDCGFARLTTHEAFQQTHVIATWDFVNGDSNVENGSDMGEGSHGTMTLSAIGGYKDGKLIGIAFGADFVLAKTENTESETPIEEDNWIAALEWEDSIGVDLTSTSLGYLTFDAPYTSYTWQSMNGNTCRITIAADLAVKRGIVIVNSAGNEGGNESHNTLIAPADGDSVISIGAVDISDTRVDFSSVGPTVDGRIKPDVMALGIGGTTAESSGDYDYSNGGSGTSFACPLSAGVAALILAAHPEYTPMQVRDAMRNTASNHTSPDNLFGWGILNALNAINYTPLAVETDPVRDMNYRLFQNYPNPFNPSTVIKYSLPVEGNVKIAVYDVLGKEVKTLLNSNQTAGEHEIQLTSAGMASGIYFVQLWAGTVRQNIKICLTK